VVLKFVEVLVPSFVVTAASDGRAAPFTEGVLHRFVPLLYVLFFESHMGTSVALTQHAGAVATYCNRYS
jgi:hypothetical protein